MVPHRQLFLVRNIRKFKLRNALGKSSTPSSPGGSPVNVAAANVDSAKSPASPTSSTVVTSTSTTTETATVNIEENAQSNNVDSSVVIKSTVESNETIASTTSSGSTSVETTKTVSESSSAVSTATTTTTTTNANADKSDASAPDETVQTNNNNVSSTNNNNQSSVEIKSRALERVGTGCNDGYFIDDRSEININFQKYRMVFVVNKDAVFYKKNAFRQAKTVNSVFLFLSKSHIAFEHQN